MNVEARFLGGPAEGEIRQVPDLMREIKVAHMPPMPGGWWNAPDIGEVAFETHIYEPTRVVAYYTYRGTR